MNEKDEDLEFEGLEDVKEESTKEIAEDTAGTDFDELLDEDNKDKKEAKDNKRDVGELFKDEEEEKPKKKAAPKKSTTYKGPKQIRVYGKELFIIPEEEVKDYTDSKIINRIAEEFGFKEFKVNNTELKLDSTNGNVDVKIKFQNKG